ncbi:MAG: B12-binding domain-containing radical SAM protein [Proteobacteria bacterium]|nr:B12-binding domain-containing radical SAM protein [Pseudomonadota bacterium]
MARILFLESELRNEKLGIMYLSAALREAGHQSMLCWIEREDVHGLIASFRPDFLAVSLVTGSHGPLLALASELRSRYGLAVIAGGPHATFFSSEIPEDAADYVVVGQGELAMVDIVEGRAPERMLCYDLADLGTLPFPDRELFYRFPEFRNNPMKNFITCRDCPYSCSYCYNHAWKEKFKSQQHFLQKRSVDDVLDEIREVKARYPLEQVMFIDDNFLLKRAWIEEFCESYPVRVGLPFLCCFSLNLLDEELLMRLKKAGLFMINFALESADPMVQKDILNRGHIRNEQIVQAIRLLSKHKIKTRMQNMIGMPVADPLRDALATLEFNRKHRVDDSWVSILQPYPNTRLAGYCVAQGFINENEIAYAPSFFDRTGLKIPDADKIARLQKWWYFAIKYNLSEDTLHQFLDLELSEGAANALLLLRFEFSKKYLYGVSAASGILRHNAQLIQKRHGHKEHFPIFWPIIARYRLCNGLADILMSLAPSGAAPHLPREPHGDTPHA